MFKQIMLMGIASLLSCYNCAAQNRYNIHACTKDIDQFKRQHPNWYFPPEKRKPEIEPKQAKGVATQTVPETNTIQDKLNDFNMRSTNAHDNGLYRSFTFDTIVITHPLNRLASSIKDELRSNAAAYLGGTVYGILLLCYLSNS